MTKVERQARVDTFKEEILKVCEKHGLTLVPYHIDYDEYDTEDGLRVEPGDPHQIRNAMPTSGAFYWRRFK